MNVVDSSAWLDYFAGGRNAGHFASAIEDSDALVVPTLVVHEVFKKVLRTEGEAQALRVVAAMMQGRVVDLTSAIALESARLALAHNLPLADSVILATARAHNATLWTQDAHFQGLDMVEYHP